MKIFKNNPYYKKCLCDLNYFIPEPEKIKGTWARDFNEKKIFLDIGCGGGTYIVELARRNKGIFFVGVDFSIKFLYSAIKKAKANKLKNIVFIYSNATEIQNVFDKDEIEGVFFLFSDPYKKNKQKKHRVFSKKFLLQISNLLKNNKYFVVKTDDLNYFNQIVKEFEATDKFQIIKLSNDFSFSEFYLWDIESHYEQKFNFKNINWLVAVNLKKEGRVK